MPHRCGIITAREPPPKQLTLEEGEWGGGGGGGASNVHTGQNNVTTEYNKVLAEGTRYAYVCAQCVCKSSVSTTPVVYTCT